MITGYFVCIVFLQNEAVNGHFKNISFMCADVTSSDLKIEEESVDLIFSNWLLMYLSDKEVIRCLQAAVSASYMYLDLRIREPINIICDLNIT